MHERLHGLRLANIHLTARPLGEDGDAAAVFRLKPWRGGWKGALRRGGLAICAGGIGTPEIGAEPRTD